MAAIKQSAFGLNRSHSSNIWWLKSTNHITFTKQYMMYKKADFSFQNVHKWVKIGLSQRIWVQKKVRSVETLTHRKRKIPAAAFSKEIQPDKLLGHEMAHRRSCNCKKCSGSVLVVKAVVGEILVSEFELQSRYYVHFLTNTLWKGMNTLILPAMG